MSASLHPFVVLQIAVPSILEPQHGKASVRACGSKFHRVNQISDGGRNIVIICIKGKEGHSGSQGICATTVKLPCIETEGRKKKA